MEECSGRELAELTRELLSTLQPREEKILRARFGIDGQPAETLEKIGKNLQSLERTDSPDRKKALRKLRNPNRQACLRTFWSDLRPGAADQICHVAPVKILALLWAINFVPPFLTYLFEDRGNTPLDRGYCLAMATAVRCP